MLSVRLIATRDPLAHIQDFVDTDDENHLHITLKVKLPLSVAPILNRAHFPHVDGAFVKLCDRDAHQIEVHGIKTHTREL